MIFWVRSKPTWVRLIYSMEQQQWRIGRLQSKKTRVKTDMLRSISKQSGESVESVRKKRKKKKWLLRWFEGHSTCGKPARKWSDDHGITNWHGCIMLWPTEMNGEESPAPMAHMDHELRKTVQFSCNLNDTWQWLKTVFSRQNMHVSTQYH